MPALALHSFAKAIQIPAGLRDQPLGAWQTSARLSALLERFGIHVLGDLHGRKVADFAWEKNCGPKTLYELDLLARRVAAEKLQKDGASFGILDSVRHLSLQELPITTRLANVVRSIGARTLGDLDGRNAFELLQYKACGWRTISEIQQLIDRAVSGEFDLGQIKEATAVAELLSLIEQGLAKLPHRDRQFVLAKIGGETGGTRSPGANLLCLSYAEIGRRYRLTRARVHKVFGNTLDTLKKAWGPRVPRLLEVIRWRCLSTICPLTPQLLEKWAEASVASSPRHASAATIRLSMEARVRLIAALDKRIPCWSMTIRKVRRIDSLNCQFDLALAQLVCEAGGHISVAKAFRKMSRAARRDCHALTVQKFLSMLWNGECAVVELKNPERPIIRLNPKLRIFTGRTAIDNGRQQMAERFTPIHHQSICLSQASFSANTTRR